MSVGRTLRRRPGAGGPADADAVAAASVDAPLEASVAAPVQGERPAGRVDVLERAWIRLGGAELLLLAPVPLVLLARLDIQPRIDASAAAALSVVLPIVLGMAAVAVPAAIVRRRRHDWTVIDLGTAAALGLILTLALACVLAAVGRFSPRVFGLVVVGGGVLAWAGLRAMDIVAARNGVQADRRAAAVPWLDLLAGLFVAALGVGLAAWYRGNSPVPFHPQWDAFAHLRIIDGMAAGLWSPWTTDYSSTFRVNAYFPVQQLLTAVASNLGRVNPLAVYWGGVFAIMPVVAVLGYAVARVMRVRVTTAVVAAGAAMVAGLTFQATAFLGLLPLALAYPFFSVALLTVMSAASWPRLVATVVVVGAGALAAHWLVGGAVLAFGAGLLVVRYLDERYGRLWVIALLAIAAVVAVMVLGYTNLRPLPGRPLGIETGDERFFGRVVSLASRQRDFEQRLSPVIAFASAAGALILAWRARRGSRRIIPAIGWAGCLIALALPIAGADRGFVVLPTIVAATIAVAIDTTVTWALRPGPSPGERGLVAGVGLAVLIVLAMQPVFWLRYYQGNLAADAPFFSSFARTELDAGNVIRFQTPGSSFIVGDPVTQEILGGLGNRESYGGGPYASDAQLEALRTALLAPDAESTWSELGDLAEGTGAKGPVLVAITGRTGNWLDHDIGFWPGYYSPLTTWRDERLSPIAEILERLGDERWFQPVVVNDDVVIVALRPGPDEPVEGIGEPKIGSRPPSTLGAKAGRG